MTDWETMGQTPLPEEDENGAGMGKRVAFTGEAKTELRAIP